MNVIVCSRCGASFSDTMFHITTSTGHIYCEQCVFEAMAKRREQE